MNIIYDHNAFMVRCVHVFSQYILRFTAQLNHRRDIYKLDKSGIRRSSFKREKIKNTKRKSTILCPSICSTSWNQSPFVELLPGINSCIWYKNKSYSTEMFSTCEQLFVQSSWSWIYFHASFHARRGPIATTTPSWLMTLENHWPCKTMTNRAPFHVCNRSYYKARWFVCMCNTFIYTTFVDLL